MIAVRYFLITVRAAACERPGPRSEGSKFERPLRPELGQLRCSGWLNNPPPSSNPRTEEGSKAVKRRRPLSWDVEIPKALMLDLYFPSIL